MLHTILGAGGTVANALTYELILNNQQVRLISRRPVKFESSTVSWQKADLLNYKETLEACKGSSIIYICNGVGTKNEDWKKLWPIIMKNAIDIAKATQARLLFFDNTYMYGVVNGTMTEATPYNPCTVKGEARAKIATHFTDELKAGNIKGSIARAGGFYGTDSMISMLDTMVLNRYAKNKKAFWISNPNYLHNFTFIADAAKGLYLLGQHPESDNQIWHVPTAAPIKGTEFLKIAAGLYGREPTCFSISKPVLQFMGLFNPRAASISEMYYQYNRDYNFDSSKFNTAFNFVPTSFYNGIKQMSETFYKKQV